MIIVTGATGELGRAITSRLLEKVPSGQLGVSVREPAKASALQARGVRVRKASFDDPASLRAAFEGASQVLIISSNSSGADAVAHHGNAIDAAKAAGAKRVLYTSHMGANPGSLFQPMVDHAATEALLERSGLAFTSLRNGFYASSALMMLGNAVESGKLFAPEDGPVSWTAHADLADAAVIALTREGALDGITAPLTSTRALDLAGVAAIASEVSGRPIERVTVTHEAYGETMASHGVPRERIALMSGLYKASHRGEFAAIDPRLEQLLGRAPLSLHDVVRSQTPKR